MKLSQEAQTEITRVAVLAGQLLHQHGAESRLIEQTAQRLGLALGAETTSAKVTDGKLRLIDTSRHWRCSKK